MADKISMVDTTILIDYFRKKDKAKARLVTLSASFEKICITSITEFEIYTGATPSQLDFWNEMLKGFRIFPFDSRAAQAAVMIQQNLKRLRKSIEKADLFIAAIAVAHSLQLETLNKKHFENIEQLRLHSLNH